MIKKDVDAEAELGEGNETIKKTIIIAGAIISLATVLYIFHYVKKALRAVGIEQSPSRISPAAEMCVMKSDVQLIDDIRRA